MENVKESSVYGIAAHTVCSVATFSIGKDALERYPWKVDYSSRGSAQNVIIIGILLHLS